MKLTDAEATEFRSAIQELLDSGEQGLLALAKGESFGSHYDVIFRAFHNIKSAAGFLELDVLQNHIHQLESLLLSQKGKPSLDRGHIDLFLKGIDAAREMLAGRNTAFVMDAAKEAPEVPVAARPAPAPAPAETKAPSEPSAKMLAAGRILCIDDSRSIVSAMTHMLTEVGFEVKGITSPQDALAMIESFQPETVITDIEMPGINGVQLLEMIRKRDADLPVIFVSGSVTKEILMESIRLGISAVVEKPFRDALVIQACLESCRRYRLSKLLSRSIHLLLYQLPELDEYLRASGQEEARVRLNAELKELMARRRELKEYVKR